MGAPAASPAAAPAASPAASPASSWRRLLPFERERSARRASKREGARLLRRPLGAGGIRGRRWGQQRWLGGSWRAGRLRRVGGGAEATALALAELAVGLGKGGLAESLAALDLGVVLVKRRAADAAGAEAARLTLAHPAVDRVKANGTPRLAALVFAVARHAGLALAPIAAATLAERAMLRGRQFGVAEFLARRHLAIPNADGRVAAT